MELLAAQAPEKIDFGTTDQADETEKEAERPLNPLDAKSLKEKALAARKSQETKKDPEIVYPQETIDKYIADLALYVQWSAEQGELEFTWDCKALDPGLVQIIASEFKVLHGTGIMVIYSSNSILCDWSGHNEV